MHLIVTIVTTASLLLLSNCFNFDVNQVVTKKIKKDASMFGFSVSPHYLRADKSHRVLVGAPKDNMVGYDGVDKTPSGAIYACPLSGLPEDCQQLRINKTTRGFFEMTYSQQFLGMSLISATAYNGSKIFACAPRRRGKNRFNSREEVLGSCYKLKNDMTVSSEIVIDFRERKTSSIHKAYWFSLIGFSLATDKHDQVLFGAPFSSVTNKSPWINSGEIYFSKDAEKLGQKIKDDAFKTRPSYPGWSVAIGNVLSSCKQTFVAGAPGIPGEDLQLMSSNEIGNGSVFIFCYKESAAVETRQRLIGSQFGSRFGHAVLVADVNKDGWDDVFVGTPDFRSNRKDRNSIGSGAVFVYLSKKGAISLEPSQVLRPPTRTCKNDDCVQAQFGFALSNLGDVNLDGYNDIGISAPGEEGGAIYVFHGGAKPFAGGQPSQRISLKTGKKLGFSLGQGMDLDNNGYPDLVAGALGSNTAAIFRTRPVIKFKMDIEFKPAILDPDLKKNPAPWRPCHSEGFCFDAVLSFSYNPASDKHSMTDDLLGEITAFAEPNERQIARVQFSDGSKLTPKLMRKVKFKRTTSKETLTLFIKSTTFMDVLRPIKLKLSWASSLKKPDALDASKAVLPNINQYPIYDKEKCKLTAELPWKTNCPSTGCESDLELRVQTSLDSGGGELVYLMGRDAAIWLNFTAVNYKGTAHLVELRLNMDESLVVDKSYCKFSCAKQANSKDIVCGIANPLKKGEGVSCKLLLSTANVKPEMRNLAFAANLTTTSRNLNTRQYKRKFNASVIIQAAVQMTSRVNVDQIVYRKFKLVGANAIQREQKIGDPRLEFSFEIENKKDTLVPASTLTVLWPYEVLKDKEERHGKYLLYLLAAPLVAGRSKKNVNCSSEALEQVVNPEGIRLLTNGIFKNYTIPRNKPKKSLKAPKFVPCSNGLARCVPIQCRLGRLGKKTGTITVTLVARVWVYTLISSFAEDNYVKIAVDAKWESDPRFDVRQVNNTITNSSIVIQASNLMERKEKKPEHFIWIIIGASIGGLILLGCIIIILWKCKFFQRKNLDKERQRMMRQSRGEPTEAESFFSHRPA